jgi:hypothetical protein
MCVMYIVENNYFKATTSEYPHAALHAEAVSESDRNGEVHLHNPYNY